jgi:hypothetical protein
MHTGEATAPVRVTHPFHPLFGQALDVVAHRHNWSEDRVYYREGRPLMFRPDRRGRAECSRLEPINRPAA